MKKIDQVLLLDWNEAEKEHILLLFSIFAKSPMVYSDEATEEEKDEFRIHGYKWNEYAIDVLGWKPSLTGAIVANPNVLLNKEGKLRIVKSEFDRVKTRSEQIVNKHTFA